MIVTVEYEGRRETVAPPATLDFGREPGGGMLVGAGDPKVSRVAGSVQVEERLAWVINQSRNHELYVVDEVRLPRELPRCTQDSPPSRWPVGPGGVLVLVPGRFWTYQLRVELQTAQSVRPDRPASAASAATDTAEGLSASGLTVPQWEAAVGLVWGYLRDYPHYDPRPRTYREVAKLLGRQVTSKAVERRIASLREQMVADGAEDLSGQSDTRHALARRLLSSRLVGMRDKAVFLGRHPWLSP